MYSQAHGTVRDLGDVRVSQAGQAVLARVWFRSVPLFRLACWACPAQDFGLALLHTTGHFRRHTNTQQSIPDQARTCAKNPLSSYKKKRSSAQNSPPSMPKSTSRNHSVHRTRSTPVAHQVWTPLALLLAHLLPACPEPSPCFMPTWPTTDSANNVVSYGPPLQCAARLGPLFPIMPIP